MPLKEIDLNPVTHITTDAIGPPGKRVFYIQGYKGQRTITLLVEKFQIQALAVGIEQFLAEIQNQFPDLSQASGDYIEENMHINPPVDPLFRVGELTLGYDFDSDMIVLVAREVVTEKEDEEILEGYVVRYWCSRSQIRAFAYWGIEVASRGRPICPLCGQPIEPEGHFCPKKNGHKDKH